jgi:C-terminal processing protease CtpA/Prc
VGPVKSDIKLTLLREECDPFDVTLTRAIVKIHTGKSCLEGDNSGSSSRQARAARRRA